MLGQGLEHVELLVRFNGQVAGPFFLRRSCLSRWLVLERRHLLLFLERGLEVWGEVERSILLQDVELLLVRQVFVPVALDDLVESLHPLRDLEPCSNANLAVDLDIASHLLDDVLADAQP